MGYNILEISESEEDKFFWKNRSYLNNMAMIFDCDGTLIDSEKYHFMSWKKALERQGFSLTKSDYYKFSGKSVEYISSSFENLKINTKKLLEDKKAFYKTMQKEGIPPIERTINFIKYLKKQNTNIKLAVASAGYKKEILNNLINLKIVKFFDVITSGMEDLSSYNNLNKPSPYIYLHTAKLLNIPSQNCIAFEDSFSGILSAKNANMLTIALPNSFTVKHDFSHADLIIKPSENIFMKTLLKLYTDRMKISVGK